MPKELTVRKVTKVMNANIWQDYAMRRETVCYKDGWFAKKKQQVVGFPAGVKPPAGYSPAPLMLLLLAV